MGIKRIKTFNIAVLILLITVVQVMSLVSQGLQDTMTLAGAGEKCLVCHQGIEPISDVPQMASLPCTFCHKGDGTTEDKEAAHTGLIRNPGDLRVVDETCGLCHADIVDRVKKSLHATSAGIISGVRYSAGAQSTKMAIYSVVAVADTDGDVPVEKGAVSELKQLPRFDPGKSWNESNHPVDAYLRNQCLRCHVWTRGHEQYGDWRSSGCSACHVIYSDDGLYRGNDPTIPKDVPGHPVEHRITSRIPTFQCVHCHNRGARTGVSFMGMMEADPYGYPWSTKPGVKGAQKIHGKYYHYLIPDIHYERGLHCIDCHTEREVHGDGNIYSKRWQAIEIECTSCHGTPEEYGTLTTENGNPITNARREGDRSILVSKVTGKEHVIPQLKDLAGKGLLSTEGYTAMVAIPQHMKKMECYACHAKWAPQCYGCHVQIDLGSPASDWLSYNETAISDPSMIAQKNNRLKTAYTARETRTYLRWESPVLGINPEGKVSPFIPGCQDIYTIIGPNGEVIMHNQPFTTYDGFPSISHSPVQPHTIRPDARPCEDCHANPKALGLGSGFFRVTESNLPMELDKIVDWNGTQLQSINHPGARPFNAQELRKILKIGTCFACHQSYSDPIWNDIRAVTGVAENPEAHIRAVKTVLEEAVKPAIVQTVTQTTTKTITETQTITETETSTLTKTETTMLPTTVTVTGEAPLITTPAAIIIVILVIIVVAALALRKR